MSRSGLKSTAMKKSKLLLTLPCYCLIVNNCSPAQAQIAPDGSLSTNVTTENNQNFTIEQGNRAGNNLFHSFREFSVPTGGEAFFNNAADIQNIFSRVTGGSVSNIDGLIRANGGANLFLLNPSGIIFGPNASLSIGGSFFASTASSLIFSDGTQFSATNNQNSPLLTISVPIGLQYGNTVNPIRVQGLPGATESFDTESKSLGVNKGNTLAILGGNVIIDGGILQAPGGRIEVGGLAGEGTITIDEGGSLSFPSGGQRGDVSIINQAKISVLAGGGGDIAINAQNLEISGESLLASGIGRGLGMQGAKAGNISLNATGAITITASSIQNNVNLGTQEQPAAIGDGGDIIIKAGSTLATDKAYITAVTFGQGNGGNIIIKANTVSLTNGTYVDSFTGGIGNAGNIEINSKDNFVITGSRISSSAIFKDSGDAGDISIVSDGSIFIHGNTRIGNSNFFSGNAGNIDLNAKDSISIVNSRIFSNSFDTNKSGSGFAGTITIKAGNSFALSSESEITSATLSEAQESESGSRWGTILIDAGSVSLSDRAILSTTAYGVVAGGDIRIQTQTLSLTDGSRITAESVGSGKAGNIIVNAAKSVTLSGFAPLEFEQGWPFFGGMSSGLFANTETLNSGAGGNIEVNTGNLQITNGAVISARTQSSDPGGNISVNVDNLNITEGGQIIATALSSGNAGNITVIAKDRITISGSDRTFTDRFNAVKQAYPELDTMSIIATDNAASSLSVNNQGIGAGGNIILEARQIRLENGLENEVAIAAETASGNGGNIQLKAPDLILLRRNSNISTTAGSKGAGGDGGNITINTSNLVALENSDITANAFAGKGGRVLITAQAIFGAQSRTEETPKSDITAISQIGGPELSGTVELNTPDVDPSSGLIELPQTVVDISGLSDRRCSPNAQQSSFVVTGRGGLPPSPTEPLDDNPYLVDLVNINPQPQVNRAGSQQVSRGESPQIAEIVEAQGWIINDKGQVVLVANPPNVTPHRSGLIPIGCHVR